MTKKQKEVIQIIFDLVKENQIDPSDVDESHFSSQVKQAGLRISWSLLDTYRKDNKRFDFITLFSEVLEENIDVKEETEILTVDIEAEVSKNVDEEETEPVKEAPTPKPKQRQRSGSRKISAVPESKKKLYKNPIYIVESIDCSNESRLVGAAGSFSSAYDKHLYNAIHDSGTLSFEDAEVEIEIKGATRIGSVHSNNLYCLISKIELD
jgi:hypothetical protein